MGWVLSPGRSLSKEKGGEEGGGYSYANANSSNRHKRKNNKSRGRKGETMQAKDKTKLLKKAKQSKTKKYIRKTLRRRKKVSV